MCLQCDPNASIGQDCPVLRCVTKEATSDIGDQRIKQTVRTKKIEFQFFLVRIFKLKSLVSSGYGMRNMCFLFHNKTKELKNY